MEQSIDYREKLRIAVKALREIRDAQGRVCSNFELCKHVACQSSYSSWVISDKALGEIEEINKHGCLIYKSLEETGIPELYREQGENWIDEGKGIAVYAIPEDDLTYGPRPRKYCSFGIESATIPNCEIPPNTLPRLSPNMNIKTVHYLIGYLPKRKTIDLDKIKGEYKCMK